MVTVNTIVFVGGYGREGLIDIMQRIQGRDAAL